MSGYFADEAGRDAYLKGMRDLIEFLEAHPEIPVPQHEERIQLSTYGTDAEKCATVVDVATVLETEPVWEGRHFRATRTFGPIRFFVVAIVTPPYAKKIQRQLAAECLDERIEAVA